VCAVRIWSRAYAQLPIVADMTLMAPVHRIRFMISAKERKKRSIFPSPSQTRKAAISTAEVLVLLESRHRATRADGETWPVIAPRIVVAVPRTSGAHRLRIAGDNGHHAGLMIGSKRVWTDTAELSNCFFLARPDMVA